MFFTELEQLQREHPSLASIITRIDAHLSKFNDTAIANPVDFATFLAADQNQVFAVFDKLVAAGILHKIEMCECDKCKMTVPSADYKSHRESGDELLCTNCGGDLVQNTPRQFKVFRLSTRALQETEKHKMAQNTKTV